MITFYPFLRKAFAVLELSCAAEAKSFCKSVLASMVWECF